MATHPGEVLKQELKDRQMSQAELARRAGWSKDVVYRMIHKQQHFEYSDCLKLELALGIGAYVWSNLQTRWDEEQRRLYYQQNYGF